MIHSTAIIDPSSQIGEDVSIGAYSVIGPGVEIGRNTVISSHVMIAGPTRIGNNNKIHPFSSVGADPQDKKFQGEAESFLEIGNDNVIREYCSINRGTALGGGVTRLGDSNWIMAYVHIAHDCILGSHNILANNTTLAGHVAIDDHVTLGGFTGIHQFCHIGSYSFTARASMVLKDIPPYLMAAGNSAKPYGLNKEGLKRNGFTADVINNIRRAYRILYQEGLVLAEAMIRLDDLARESVEVHSFLEFLKKSERGIIR